MDWRALYPQRTSGSNSFTHLHWCVHTHTHRPQKVHWRLNIREMASLVSRRMAMMAWGSLDIGGTNNPVSFFLFSYPGSLGRPLGQGGVEFRGQSSGPGSWARTCAGGWPETGRRWRHTWSQACFPWSSCPPPPAGACSWHRSMGCVPESPPRRKSSWS